MKLTLAFPCPPSERGGSRSPPAPNSGGVRLRLPRIGAGGLLLLLLAAGCGHKSADAPAKADTADKAAKPVVQVAAVATGPIDETLNVTGVLQPIPGHESKVNAPIAGTLAAVYARLNEDVMRGQVVAQMSTLPLDGQMRQAEATIAANKLQVEQAKVNALQQDAATQSAVAQAQAAQAGAQAGFQGAVRTLDRERKLYTDGLVAAKDVEDAQVVVETSQATLSAQVQAVAAARAGALTSLARRKDISIAEEQVKNAQGALTTAKAQIALATIHAPTSGTVTSVSATGGETADPATPLMTIVDTSDLQLSVSILSGSLAQVHRGQTVRFTVEPLPKRIFMGTVTNIGTQVDPANGAVPVTIRIRNASPLLKDDMFATGQIVVRHIPDALLVPKSAILTDPASNETSVVVVDKDDTAQTIPVKTGLTIGDRIQVKSGVKTGERVIVAGEYALPDKTEVTVQNGS